MDYTERRVLEMLYVKKYIKFPLIDLLIKCSKGFYYFYIIIQNNLSIVLHEVCNRPKHAYALYKLNI